MVELLIGFQACLNFGGTPRADRLAEGQTKHRACNMVEFRWHHSRSSSSHIIVFHFVSEHATTRCFPILYCKCRQPHAQLCLTELGEHSIWEEILNSIAMVQDFSTARLVLKRVPRQEGAATSVLLRHAQCALAVRPRRFPMRTHAALVAEKSAAHPIIRALVCLCHAKRETEKNGKGRIATCQTLGTRMIA